MPKWRSWAGPVLLWALWGCDGCVGSKTATLAPVRFIEESAEAVIEIRDLGVLVRGRVKALEHLGSIVTPAQLRALVHELELSLGFDPTSEEGLRKAGLSASRSIAVQIVGGGRGALWVVPVADRSAFEKAIEGIVRARTAVDEIERVDMGGVAGRRFVTQFGPKTIVSAAYALHEGHALIGVGTSAEARVARAVEVAKVEASSIALNPAYRQLTEELGGHWEVRFIAPSGERVLASALQRIGQMVGVPELSRFDSSLVQSVGGFLDFRGTQAVARGRILLSPKGQKSLAEVLRAPSAKPGAVAQLDLRDAFLYVQAAGHPEGLLRGLAPAGSRLRRRVDAYLARVNKETDVDVPRDVLPHLSGHGAFALGISDLTGVGLTELRRNPLSATWGAMAVGLTDPEAAERIRTRIEPRLSARRLVRERRTVGAHTVVAYRRDAPGAAPLMESVLVDDTWMFASSPRVTADLLGAPEGLKAPPMSAGLVAQLRFQTLSKSLERMRYGDLPILYRSIASKLVSMVGLLRDAEFRITPTKDALEVGATLSLASRPGEDS